MKTNYAYAKRQRDLAKKQRKEEKRLRKAPQDPPPPGAVQAETQGEKDTQAPSDQGVA